MGEAVKAQISDREILNLLINQITEYAIFLLSPTGEVASWNPGAERIKGYTAADIIGKHFRTFYPPEDQAAQKPEYELEVAAQIGRFEDEGWRVRKDGSCFWANVIITAIRGTNGKLLGYGKVTRDLTERKKSEEQLRELSSRLLRMQDEDRGRLGRELHDSVGQNLAAAKMALDGLSYQGETSREQLFKEAAESTLLIERCIQEVRSLSYLLYPPMLDEMGLPSAIGWYLDGFSKRSGIQTTLEADFKGRLPHDIEMALFRIVQESLTNIHRHSQSATARIRFSVIGNRACVEIRDEGKGIGSGALDFNLNSPAKWGVGVRGMRERVRQFGGQLDLASSDQGTTVTATIPVEIRTQSPFAHGRTH